MKTSVIEKDDGHKAVKAESGLLLDRAKLAAFIKEQKVNDSTAALLRSIYKNRNYQVAWFTESGIAETPVHSGLFTTITSTILEIQHSFLMHCNTRSKRILVPCFFSLSFGLFDQREYFGRHTTVIYLNTAHFRCLKL